MEPLTARPSLARERKLLHWINSLPLASCLLVDALDELRLGDVLEDIVAWLADDRGATSYLPRDARASVARAVDFAAQRCTATDGDVTVVLNSASCVADIVDGDVTAIAAVVSVLRRLASEKEAAATAQTQAHRWHARQAMADRATSGMPKSTAVTLPKALPVTQQKRNLQSRNSPPRPPTASTSSKPSLPSLPGEQSKENERSNRRSQSSRQEPVVVDDPHMLGVVAWMATLGVMTTATTLSDGVALCQLAASVARRRGSIAVRHSLHSCALPQQSRGVLFPRGATPQPRTKAEKHHNVRVAWALLKDCHVLPDAAMGLTPEAVVEGVEVNDASIWRILSHVQNRVQQSAPNYSTPPITTVLVDEIRGARRPYITSEQMDTVKRWMKAQDVDPIAVSSGILEDRLRNGVALCRLISKTKLCKRFSRSACRDPPKTLLEVRGNLHAAITALVGLEDSRIPAVYLTKQSVEAIATGDKQCIYGLLWHAMQVYHDDASRGRQADAETVTSVAPSASRVLVRKVPSVPVSRRDEAPPKVTSLLLDVPAIQLVEDEYGDGELTSVVGARSAAWEAMSLLDGINDIVPMATTPIMDTKDAQDDDIVPVQRDERLDAAVATTEPVSISAESQRTPTQHEEHHALPPPPPPPAPYETSPDPQVSLTEPQSKEESDAQQHNIDPESPAPIPVTAGVVYTAAQVRQVVQWLGHLGIDLHDLDAFHNTSANLEEFRSGVLLCTIVEKLEHMRRMDGVCRHEPLTQAMALHNIDKAFAILRRKNTLPQSLFRRKFEIYRGDRTTILTLLVHMRKAYGPHIKSLHKPVLQVEVATPN